MQGSAAGPHGWVQFLLPLAVFAIVFTLRARSLSRQRPLKLERLWIVPAIYSVVCAILLFEHPPSLLGWAAGLVGLLLGAALGWQRGRMMRIWVDPETHALSQKSSIAGIAFLFLLVAIRAAARGEAGAYHLDVALLTDVLALFALGLFSCQRLEMYLRATRLLEAARAGRA